MSFNIDNLLDGRDKARGRAEERMVTRLDRLEAKAEKLIGELCREGKPVFYVTTRTGKTREATARYELVDFLIRNQYV